MGNSGDGSGNLDGSRGGLVEEPETESAPVLGGVSDDELDAIVGQLRTDKRRTVAPASQQRARGEMMSERLHRGRPLVSSVQAEAPSHAWYVALDGQASGPHDVAALKVHCEQGALGPDSLCWREGFSEWLPLAQVPELAEALVPHPPEKLPSAEDLRAAAGADAPGFAPKGAEALRALSGGAVAPPSLAATTEQVAGAAALGSGSVGAPASGGMHGPGPGSTGDGVQGSMARQPRAEGLAAVGTGAGVQGSMAQQPRAEGLAAAGPGLADGAGAQASVASHAPGDGIADIAGALARGGGSADPAVMQPVLADAPRQEKERSRWRGAVWLTAMGGIAGGVTVAVTLGLLGHVDGRALAARLGFGEAAPVANSAATLPGAANADGTPAMTGAGQGANAAGTGSVASSSTTGPGAVAPPGTSGVAAAPGAPPGTSGVGAVTGTSPASPGVGAVSGTQPGTSGTGIAASGAAGTSGPVAGTRAASPLGAVGIDKGGSVPALASRDEATGASVRAPAPSWDSSLTTDSLPSRAPPPRSSVSAATLEKPAVGPPPVEKAAADAKPNADAAPASKEPKSDLGPDEDYERELLDPPAGPREPPRTVYVPPDPAVPPVSLADSDIFEVVLANKGDLSACVSAEDRSSLGADIRVVVRWNILPSGRVDAVATETAALKGTPLARCIEDKVRALRFPKHQEQGGLIRFPFVF